MAVLMAVPIVLGPLSPGLVDACVIVVVCVAITRGSNCADIGCRGFGITMGLFLISLSTVLLVGLVLVSSDPSLDSSSSGPFKASSVGCIVFSAVSISAAPTSPKSRTLPG